jgi:BirA family biotin operon repressor/biotin-[acetyl-CoA-carboxylase] ligase
VSARLGTPRVHLRVTDSTNARAGALAHAGAPHGTLVTASEQTAGRGRQGRGWSAPPGSSLLMSLVLRSPPPLTALLAGVAVAETIGPDAGLKWPNDVLGADGRKVCGILVEGRPQEDWAVLGIGLNVAVRSEDLPSDLRDRAGTLGLDAAAIEPLLEALLRGLEGWLSAPASEVLAAFGARDALRGRAVAWATGEGVAAGIDADGRLVVTLDSGARTELAAGEVHLRD